jgi:Ca2+-binding RTX toxin-like protein
MQGGSGNDVFIVSDQADVVDPGNGVDEVRTALAVYSVHQFIERAVYTGTGNWNVTGSTGLGSTGSNTIIGGDGQDTIHGGVGIFSGDDALYGGKGNDSLIGDFGFDWLDGGKGRDTMAGGADSDTYVVDNAADVIIENAGEGTDVVESKIDWTLGAHLEFLTLTGKRDRSGTGNDLDNVMTGNAGKNVLAGGIGNDTLRGLDAADTLTGGANADTFQFLALRDSGPQANSRDTITDFNAAEGDRIDLSALDAMASQAGDQAFVLDADNSFSEGEIRITLVGAGQYLVEANANADAGAEFSIMVFSATAPVAGDFIL